MSNQTYAAPFVPYFSASSEQDHLGLAKNNPAGGGNAAYGNAKKTLTNQGVGLYFTSLNESDVMTVGVAVNYALYQNPKTIPFWNISANSGVLGGATVVYVKQNCVIAVNAVLPIDYPDNGAGAAIITKLAISVLDSTLTVIRNYDAKQSDIPRLTAPFEHGLCATISVLAGQAIMISGYSTTVGAVLEYKDDLSGNTTITFPCFVEIARV